MNDVTDESVADHVQPSIRVAPHFAGWLRRFAFKQDELRAAVLRNAAEVIDLQRAEIHRLHTALEALQDAAGVREDANG
jgi:hypothetical protein